MGSRKITKPQNITLFGIVEGWTERTFLDYLIEVYKPRKNNIALSIENKEGIYYADLAVQDVINPKEGDFDRTFIWLDEDFKPNYSIGGETKKNLIRCWKVDKKKEKNFLKCQIKDLQKKYNPKKSNPILIISNPVCCESIIIKVLNHTIPDSCKECDQNKRKAQINSLKDKLAQIIGSKESTEQTNYYRKNLNKRNLELARKSVFELDLLISLITK